MSQVGVEGRSVGVGVTGAVPCVHALAEQPDLLGLKGVVDVWKACAQQASTQGWCPIQGSGEDSALMVHGCSVRAQVVRMWCLQVQFPTSRGLKIRNGFQMSKAKPDPFTDVLFRVLEKFTLVSSLWDRLESLHVREPCAQTCLISSLSLMAPDV